MTSESNPVESDDAAVFKALSDESRRRLLDALYARDGQSVTELAEVLPDVTRFAVMKHLAVLDAAHLVVAVRSGRTKRHFLNPVPIQHIHDRWLAKFARPFTQAMTDLRRQLEQESS